MKWRMAQNAILAVCAGVALLISGCGSSNVNVITVTVTPSGNTVLPGQVATFTATVGGSTVTTVTNWVCSYSYTPLATTAQPNPKPITGNNCASGGTISGVTGNIGTWVITTTNGSNVLTYTAPSLSNFPVPTPTLTFTAQADADHSKTGIATVSLSSGILVSVTPTTATVPVGITPAQTAVFFPSFQNSAPTNAMFSLVQPNSGQTTNLNDQTANPQSDTCDPMCGSIDANGKYTAPATLPTDTKPPKSTSTAPTTVYVVVWSKADPSRWALATITLVNSTTNPVNFTGLYPDTIAAGGLLQDVFLSAKNLLNTTLINFVPPTAQANLTPSSGQPLSSTQIFTVPISAAYCTATPTGTTATPVVTCDASIMTRVRLLSDQLKLAEPDANHPAWIMMPSIPGSPAAAAPCVVVPGAAGSTTAIACPIHLVNSSPALVAGVPDGFPQNSANGTVLLGVDGGYFGSTGGLVNLFFNGQQTLVSTGSSGARQSFGTIANSQIPSPGLYEMSVLSNTTQGTAPLFKSATTNVAVQPAFTTAPTPVSVPLIASGQPAMNLAPSAIALNSVKGYAVLAEQASDTLQYVDLTGSTPAVAAPFSMLTGAPTSSAPTDIAIDNQLSVNTGDLGIVVSSGDSTLYLYSITQSFPYFTLINHIPVDLQTLLGQPGATGLPTPFSFGVDPTTHLGVVVYASTNIAFIVDVNPNQDGSDKRACFLPGKVAPCVVAPVSVNTGPTPKVIMQPNVSLAYVTPGGGNGSTSVVNLLQQGVSAQIAPFVSGGTSGAVRTAGITKIITQTPHGINPVLGGTVIISGVMTSTKNSDFNGTYQVLSVIDPYSFTYTQTGQPDDIESNTSTNSSGAGLGTVQYGVPYYSFSTTTSASGAAINPVTRTFAYADYNNSAAQIGFISTLDQTLTTLTLTAGSCQNCTPNPAGAPERGFRSVAFDPFTNILVAFNPSDNADPNFNGDTISLINPGGPAPSGTTNFPYRIIAATSTGQIGTGSYTPSGQTTPVTVYGPMTYDPKTKYVLVGNAGSNTLTYMNLDPAGNFQKAHIQDLQLLDTVPPYGVPVIQPPLSTTNPATAPTSCSLTDPTQPCMPQAVRVGQAAKLRVLGIGFGTTAGSLVRLDGQISGNCATAPTPPFCTNWLSDGELDVTVPATLLSVPHDYALDVQTSSGGVTNAIDLHVVGLQDMSTACKTTKTFPQGPEGVAVDDTRHIALVTNYACNSVSVVSIDPTGTLAPFGTILGSVTVGNNPLGIGIIPRLAYAVVANSGDTPSGTASIIDYSTPTSPKIVSWNVTSGTTTTSANTVTVGLSPLGVSIDQDRALALVANGGSNTLSSIDLTVLFPSDATNTAANVGHVQGAATATTIALSGPPTAIAVDPNRDIAVVTNLQNSGTTSASGGLDVVTLATNPPIKSSTTSVSSLAASLTGIVYDPGTPTTSSTTQTGLFYATSTQANAIYSFNPDIGSTQTVRVGINPYSLGFNYQTGTLLTINSTSNSSSVVDIQNFKTRQTLGISSMSQFAIDVDNITNIAVIADQNNNRLIFLAFPK